MSVRHIWERLQGEPLKAFRAFVVYRDAGDDRCHRLVADVLGHKSIATEKVWSKRYHWAERVGEYDNYLANVVVDKRAKAVERMYDIWVDAHEKIANRLVAVATGEKQPYGKKIDKVALDAMKDLADRIGAVAVKSVEVNTSSSLESLLTDLADEDGTPDPDDADGDEE